jgi:beta-lactamase regulating signal transducer with metallopeptidase domain
MIAHLIHSSLLALLFYGVYKLFLSNETHFTFNRWYLILFPVVSVVLPFVTLPFSINIFPESSPVKMASNVPASAQSVVVNSIDASQVVPESVLFDISSLYMVYAVFALLALCMLFYKVSSLEELIERGKTKFFKKLLVTRVRESGVAFSYFNRVIIDEKFDAVATAHIMKHEKVHIKQKHSYDLLYYEILKIVFWFHPVAYLAQRELQKNHEFLVDKQLSSTESVTYQEQLLKITLGCPDFSFLNHYNKNSLLKKRILMLQKTTTTSSMKKLLWIIPVLCASVLYTACTQDPMTEADLESDTETMYLKDFKEGQVDFYKGLSEEEIALYEKHKDVSIWWDGPEHFEFLKSDEGQRFLRTHLTIERNGATYVIEQDNNNQLVKVQERPDGRIMYSDVSDRSEMDLETYMETLTYLNEYMTKSPSEREQFLKDLKQKIKIQNNDSDGDIEIREEVEPLDENYQPLDGNTLPFAVVDEAPHFSQCTGTQKEIRDCTSDEITKVINRNFKTGKFKHLRGTQKINVQFKIDTSGNVVNVKAASRDPLLREEAKRVVSLIPQLEPGKAKGTPVNVIYALPIVFQVQ